MPRYLSMGSYTSEGLKGVLKEGGSARRAAVERLLESLGGRLEALYFAFGENDFYFIYELPDNVASTAGSLLVNSTGAVRVNTVVLVTPEEVDEATKKSADYRPPGG